MKCLTLTCALLTSLLTGCASMGNWTPTVDPYRDQNVERIEQDLYECQQLADQATGGLPEDTALGIGIGALIGAAGGAAIGAIVGDPASGAAIGAAAGGLSGGVQQGVQSEQEYKNAYRRCMSLRGHNVIN